MERKGGKKGRKYGRHDRKPSGPRYTSQNHRDRNKIRRIEKMLRRFPKYVIPPGWRRSTLEKDKLIRE